jgi:signal transduction histidine kinase
MKFGIKFRLVALALAVGLMGLLIALATLDSRRRSADLRGRLAQVNSESFGIADYFRRTLNDLDDTMFSYGLTHDPAAWEAFRKTSHELDLWIDLQKPKLETTPSEKQLLQKIDNAYDDYQRVARELQAKVLASEQQNAPLAEFADFQKQSQRLFALGWSLADAHRARRNQLLMDTGMSAEYLRRLQLASLGLLFLAGLALAAVVYRDLIAPLRLKLVESQALAARQEKLASLGMLAAGVAHEIRNPLTAIKAAAFILLRKSPAASQDHADAELMLREISRLERIVNDFLQFARPGVPELTTLPAELPLQEVQLLMGHLLSEARIHLVLEPSAPMRIKADAGQLKQVLINLVQNAADSIGGGGTITLRARADRKHLNGRQTEVVILEVADTGKGIAPDVEKRLFDPFFTTKDSGTGLGLSIAARIVYEHGGALQYQTQLNLGTTFGIVLPRVPE